jgi:hypothetical protein
MDFALQIRSPTSFASAVCRRAYKTIGDNLDHDYQDAVGSKACLSPIDVKWEESIVSILWYS